MDLDSLTIGDARKLVALLGGAAAPRPCDLGADRIGKVVLVRAPYSGVWMGTLVARSADGMSVQLRSARRLWKWTGAQECSEIAEHGVTGGNIGVPCDPIVRGVAEEYVASAAAIAAVAAVKEWRA